MDPKFESKHRLKTHSAKPLPIKKSTQIIQFSNKKVTFNYSEN